MKQSSKLTRWGDSAGLRLSKPVRDRLNVRIGDELDVVAFDGAVLITKQGVKTPDADIVKLELLLQELNLTAKDLVERLS